MLIDVIKIILPTALTFFVGISITPFITNYLYKHQMWKKKTGKVTITGEAAPVFNSLHQDTENKTPRLGGSVIRISVSIVLSLIWILAFFTDGIFAKLDFLSRNQTWTPFATFLLGAFVGLIDDMLEIKGGVSHIAGGLSLRKRLFFVGLIAIAVSFWFYTKLDVVAINIPFGGELYLGPLIILLFTLVTMLMYAGGVIDGIDGLAGGMFSIMFGAYGAIAFSLGQVNLAAFCGAIAGGILAFLWFNIPPARFYMSETGSMALTITLAVVAFMTDSIAGGVGLSVLSIVALPLILTVFSIIIQLLSKKFRGKKIFHSTPIHHHFEALGWPSYKVTMRYWIFGFMCALVGVIISLLG